MLVLTRKPQERIHIGENITITVVRIQGNTVRIGIEAPKQVHVVRGEVAAKDAQTPAGSRWCPRRRGHQRRRKRKGPWRACHERGPSTCATVVPRWPPAGRRLLCAGSRRLSGGLALQSR